MVLSRSTRISILLGLYSGFFVTELIVGNVVGSLALIADSFHMLNDVASLIIALYAIKLTQKRGPSDKYSYGFHRAEILAALVNGVFLLALCFSIFIEAIERFFRLPEITRPSLVVIVGSLGLASNILGLFLFHEHNHHGHAHSSGSSPVVCSDPRAILENDTIIPPASRSGGTDPKTNPPKLPLPVARRSLDDIFAQAQNTSLNDRARPTSLPSIHPAQVRAEVIQEAEELRVWADANSWRLEAQSHGMSSSGTRWKSVKPRADAPTAEDLLANPSAHPTLDQRQKAASWEALNKDIEVQADGVGQGCTPGTGRVENDPGLPHHASDIGRHTTVSPGGHNHSSMNMRAIFLHVLGDALGNIGVIFTGLVIWLTKWKYRFYLDPLTSLVITFIIFSSAVPLVRSAAFIVLQGVPKGVSLPDVRKAILAIPGVVAIHDLHVWQLSESEVVASAHVLARKSTRSAYVLDGSRENLLQREERGDVHMDLSSEVRKTMRGCGIHSITVQLEYAPEGMDDEQYASLDCLVHSASK